MGRVGRAAGVSRDGGPGARRCGRRRARRQGDGLHRRSTNVEAADPCQPRRAVARRDGACRSARSRRRPSPAAIDDDRRPLGRSTRSDHGSSPASRSPPPAPRRQRPQPPRRSRHSRRDVCRQGFVEGDSRRRRASSTSSVTSSVNGVIDTQRCSTAQRSDWSSEDAIGTTVNQKNLAVHRVAAGDDAAVVALGRGSGPQEPARLTRQVDVHQRDAGRVEEQRVQHPAQPRQQRGEVGLEGCGCADRDAAHPEQSRLFGRRQGARVPDGVPEVETEVQAREDDVDAIPVMHAEGNTVGGRAVDAKRRQIGHRRRPVGERTRGGDRVSGRRRLRRRAPPTITSPNSRAVVASAARPGLWMPSSFDTRMRMSDHVQTHGQRADTRVFADPFLHVRAAGMKRRSGLRIGLVPQRPTRATRSRWPTWSRTIAHHGHPGNSGRAPAPGRPRRRSRARPTSIWSPLPAATARSRRRPRRSPGWPRPRPSPCCRWARPTTSRFSLGGADRDPDDAIAAWPHAHGAAVGISASPHRTVGRAPDRIESLGGGLVTHGIVVMERRDYTQPDPPAAQLARARHTHADVLALQAPYSLAARAR